jgi:hypothetical protein
MTVVELGDARRPVNTRRKGSRALLRRVRAGGKGTDPSLPAGSGSPTGTTAPATR